MSEPAIGYEFEAKDDDAPASPSNTRLVARISIQAFCFSQQVTETVSQAIGDRRLSRAHVTVEPGDIRAAISYFANSPTPNLLIVESEAETNQIITDIEELAGVCDGGTNVIVIGHRNDVLLYRELIRRGVSDYIVAPITALQLVEAVTSVYEDPEKGLSGNVTAFIGAKGGGWV